MNQGIAKLIRADMTALKVTVPADRAGRARKIPRAAKRFWADLTAKERGKLSKSWKRQEPTEVSVPVIDEDTFAEIMAEIAEQE